MKKVYGGIKEWGVGSLYESCVCYIRD